MNNKKKSIILSIFIILTIQIVLLINNRQKTSFRYFIWNVEEVSIGRLICISFISGLLMSSVLNKTLYIDVRTNKNNEENEGNENSTTNYDYSTNSKNSNESNEIPPERHLRDTQPTISVNYRVIKENGEYESKERNPVSENNQYNDDWNYYDSEW